MVVECGGSGAVWGGGAMRGGGGWVDYAYNCCINYAVNTIRK